MAIPYEVAEPIFVAIVAALVLLVLAAPRLAGAGGIVSGPRLRVVAGVALVAMVGSAVGFNALGAPLDPGRRSIQNGNGFGGNDPRLLAMRGSPSLDGSGPEYEYDYAYAPGAEVRMSFTLLNFSNAPLTLTEVDAGLGPNVSSVRFLLPPKVSSDAPAAYPNAYPNEPADAFANQPFHSVDMAAGAEIGIVVAVTLGQCPGASPVPTLAPSASLLSESDPSLYSGFNALSAITVRYVQLGISRSESLPLPFTMNAVTSPASTYGCLPA
jgi:hypothetical protein